MGYNGHEWAITGINVAYVTVASDIMGHKATPCKPAPAHRGGSPLPLLLLLFSNDYQATLCPYAKAPVGSFLHPRQLPDIMGIVHGRVEMSWVPLLVSAAPPFVRLYSRSNHCMR